MKKVIIALILIFSLSLCSCQSALSFLDQNADATESEIESESAKILSVLSKLNNVTNGEELVEFSKTYFENSTLDDYLAGKDETEIVLVLKVLKNIKFDSVYDDTLQYSVISTDSIFNYLQNDQTFVKEFNNLSTIGISEKELRDYVIQYLCRVLDDAELKEKTEELSVEIKFSGEKLSSDVFLVQLSDSYLTKLLERIKTSEFVEINEESEINLGDVNLEKGKGLVLPYSISDDSGNLINSVKIFVKINEVLEDEDALERLNELSPMNSSINVDYSKNKLTYVSYNIYNNSGSDLTYNNKFIAVDASGNSYTLPLGSVFGTTSDTIIKNKTEVTLDVAIISPINANVGYYDNASKNFYKLEDVD